MCVNFLLSCEDVGLDGVEGCLEDVGCFCWFQFLNFDQNVGVLFGFGEVFEGFFYRVEGTVAFQCVVWRRFVYFFYSFFYLKEEELFFVGSSMLMLQIDVDGDLVNPGVQFVVVLKVREVVMHLEKDILYYVVGVYCVYYYVNEFCDYWVVFLIEGVKVHVDFGCLGVCYVLGDCQQWCASGRYFVFVGFILVQGVCCCSVKN